MSLDEITDRTFDLIETRYLEGSKSRFEELYECRACGLIARVDRVNAQGDRTIELLACECTEATE